MAVNLVPEDFIFKSSVSWKNNQKVEKQKQTADLYANFSDVDIDNNVLISCMCEKIIF